MGSGVIFYEYEKCENYEDYDEKADTKLRTIEIKRYHFDDKYFVHYLHSVRFDPDRPYEIPIESLLVDQPLSSSSNGKSSTQGSHPSRRSSPTPRYLPRRSLSTHRVSSLSPANANSSLRHRVAGKELRPPMSWELILPSEGWMCEGDESGSEVGEKEASVETEEACEKDKEEKDLEQEEEEEEEDEEENPEEEAPAAPLLMDVDSKDDSLRLLDDLIRYHEYSPIQSGHASKKNSSGNPSDRHSVNHDASSFDLSGVWPPPSSGPSRRMPRHCYYTRGLSC
ncbi:hypothetical protein PIB30_065220 [Stylosanthes scabra]|uniref:Uncharacterized protein n=1 Tax=Stylosanthes scabra TaxID=79078 RepID=A0ABU6VKH6_9FABA|nr:hypothetical protein [Stylosanthes scabra]